MVLVPFLLRHQGRSLESDHLDASSMHKPAPSLAFEDFSPFGIAAINDEAKLPTLAQDHRQDPSTPRWNYDADACSCQGQFHRQRWHSEESALRCYNLYRPIETLFPCKAHQDGVATNDLYNRMIQILACGFQISQFVKDPNCDDSYESDQGSQNKMQNHLLLRTSDEQLRGDQPLAPEVHAPSKRLIERSQSHLVRSRLFTVAIVANMQACIEVQGDGTCAEYGPCHQERLDVTEAAGCLHRPAIKPFNVGHVARYPESHRLDGQKGEGQRQHVVLWLFRLLTPHDVALLINVLHPVVIDAGEGFPVFSDPSPFLAEVRLDDQHGDCS
mmetsp:Transcript_129552/g.307344  ORF Transcript_129552/g.307344 Transcript_129552/m.307344 type:complete len:329 (+) Transcript_129552:442-1428(+)